MEVGSWEKEITWERHGDSLGPFGFIWEHFGATWEPPWTSVLTIVASFCDPLWDQCWFLVGTMCSFSCNGFQAPFSSI